MRIFNREPKPVCPPPQTPVLQTRVRTGFGSMWNFSKGYNPNQYLCAVRQWMSDRNDRMVMVTSIFLVILVWWIVRTFFGLLLNLICPIVVVLISLILIPPMRGPMLDENFPNFVEAIKRCLRCMAMQNQPPKKNYCVVENPCKKPKKMKCKNPC